MKKVLEILKDNLMVIFSNEFFTKLKTADITSEQWKIFFVQKYGSVGYFIDFLKNGAELCKPYSSTLSDIFLQNYNDEMGIIGGYQRIEYMHETWRLMSLKEFGISSGNLQSVKLLPSTQLHSDIVVASPKSNDFLEFCGSLLFLEIFVVREMTELIKAFERTIPHHFPKDGYKAENSPNNVHEYWYNHKDHDVDHFKQIKVGLETYIGAHKGNQEEIELRVINGIQRMFEAKKHLYNEALLVAMLKN